MFTLHIGNVSFVYNFPRFDLITSFTFIFIFALFFLAGVWLFANRRNGITLILLRFYSGGYTLRATRMKIAMKKLTEVESEEIKNLYGGQPAYITPMRCLFYSVFFVLLSLIILFLFFFEINY